MIYLFFSSISSSSIMIASKVLDEPNLCTQINCSVDKLVVGLLKRTNVANCSASSVLSSVRREKSEDTNKFLSVLSSV